LSGPTWGQVSDDQNRLAAAPARAPARSSHSPVRKGHGRGRDSLQRGKSRTCPGRVGTILRFELGPLQAIPHSRRLSSKSWLAIAARQLTLASLQDRVSGAPESRIMAWQALESVKFTRHKRRPGYRYSVGFVNMSDSEPSGIFVGFNLQPIDPQGSNDQERKCATRWHENSCNRSRTR